MNLRTYNRATAGETPATTFTAAMFDIDGTLTEIGKKGIPEPLAKKLAELSMRVPLSFATGRSLPQIKEKLEEILAFASDPEKARKNWHSICENGALGYFYNPGKGDFEQYYHIKWDETVISREKLKKRLEEELKDLYDAILLRKTQLLIRVTEGEDFSKEILKKVQKIAKITKKTLKEFPGHEQFEVLDSGIAVHISPKNANKDQGIKHFAQRLGIELPAREILVVGDQAGEGRNDVALLRGEYGTPYSAGELDPDSNWPLPILDDDGGKLKGPEATLALLQKTEFPLA
ncbi:MAG: HAD-IIB family hydrolase [Patescibacteria group bacterium]|nr:HAD-IIB family hydrolase [Patescibacteria group bacterium]